MFLRFVTDVQSTYDDYRMPIKTSGVYNCKNNEAIQNSLEGKEDAKGYNTGIYVHNKNIRSAM